MRSVPMHVTRCLAVMTLLAANLAAAEKDIVETAVEAGSFKTLAAALGAADLVEVLQSDGPFTVFAPTDEAFAKLPKGTLEKLLTPAGKDQLIAILKYHVVAGAVPAKAVVKLSGAKTVNGQRVDIKVSDGKVMVDKANVIKTDIECSNGLIHVIDSVILPTSDNIPTVATKAGNFKTLLAAAKAAGLVEALSGKGPLTVFAPTDEAFAALPKGTVASLLEPQNKSKLAAILKYHVVAGRVYSEDALKAKSAKTLQGEKLRIRIQSGRAKVNDAHLVALDIDAANGVIHVIDKVLLPGAKSKKVSAADGRKMIEQSVAKGVHLYNTGHHAACAQVYMTTVQQMVELGDEMPEHVSTGLRHTLVAAGRTRCPTQRSWTLRHGLDRAYAAMRPLRSK